MRNGFLTLALTLTPFTAAVSQQKVDIHRAAVPTVSVRLGGALSPTGPVKGMKFFVEANDERALSGNKLELYVPKQARVWVKAGSAEIEATGVTGGLDLNIVGGSVRVNARPRELLVESMDG